MNKFLVQSLICAFALAGVAKGGAITLTNHGFEAGLTGWTAIGGVQATGKQFVDTRTADVWDVYPFQSTMGTLFADGVPPQQLDSFFGLAAGTLEATSQAFSTFRLFQGSGIYQDFSGAAGDTVTMAWSYVAVDVPSRNDPAFAIFVGPDGSSTIRTLATVGGAGVEVGPAGHAPWQEVTFTLQESGTHRLGFAVTNSLDSRHDPYLLLDDQPGTSAIPGLFHTSPIQPDEQSGSTYKFHNPAQAAWLEVPTARTLIYEVAGEDAFFNAFNTPPRESGFGDLLFTDLTNRTAFTIPSGTTVSLGELQVQKFRISGIPAHPKNIAGVPQQGLPLLFAFDGDPRLLTITAVPEPSSLAMMGIAAALGIARLRRKRYAAHSPRPSSSE